MGYDTYMLSKFFKNQLGFSLIQGMVLAAAVAGMAYVGTMTTSDLKLAQKTAESQLRVDQLHKTIYAILQDKGNCERTFLKNGIQPLPYTCYATVDGAHQACWAMGGTPGATHRNGEGPCASFVPPDTVCLSNNEPGFGSIGCNATTMCHGVNPGNSLIGLKNFTQGIWANNTLGTNSVAPIFKINTNIGTANYDASMMYMNNSVTIVSMELNIPANLATENALLKITYGKLDTNELSSRSGKGYGGNRIAKDIQVKIQRDPTTKGFLSCYAVTSNSNDRLHQEFCESLSTSGTTSEKLFTWDAATNTCKLNFSCGPSQIFTGWDGNGVKKCRNITDWMNLADLLGPSAACDLRTTKPVKFVKVANKIQIDCGPSTTGTTCSSACDCPGSFDVCDRGTCVSKPTGCTTGDMAKGDRICQWICGSGGLWNCSASGTPCGAAATSCSTACDCPGSYDVCDRGTCVSKPTGCTTGEMAKGDSVCQWRCNSGGWTCQVGGTACGAAATSCSSACDCPGSYDVCVRGSCVSKPTGCTDGEVAKGDASCKWACSGGMWTCPVGGTACGATSASLPANCFAAGYLCFCGTSIPASSSCSVIDRIQTSSGDMYCSNTTSSQCCDGMGTCRATTCICTDSASP